MSQAIYRSDLTETVFESFPLIAADMDTGEIVAASRPAELLFGYFVKGELVGMNVDDLVPRAVRSKHVGHRTDYAANPTLRPMGAGAKLQGQKKDGSTFTVLVALSAAVITGRKCSLAMVIGLSE